MVVVTALLAGVLVVGSASGADAAVLGSRQTATPSVPTQQMQVVEGIEATREVHAVLEKARNALGGQAKVLNVKSIAIDGQRGETTFAYRVSLPDRFRWDNGRFTFILDGASAQVPGADTLLAKKNATKTFVTQCLTLLLRAPATTKVRASVAKDGKPGVVTVAFSTAAGIALFVELDNSTYLPKTYLYVDNLVEGQCDEPPMVSAATRRVTFDEYADCDGIRFPVKMTDTISTPDGRAFSALLRFSSVRVNAGVSDTDFRQ